MPSIPSLTKRAYQVTTWRAFFPTLTFLLCLFVLFSGDKIASYITLCHLIGTQKAQIFNPFLGWLHLELIFYRSDPLWFQALDRALFYGFLLIVVFAVFARLYAGRLHKSKPAEGLHGTAYFAKDKETLLKSGLLRPKYEEDSVVIGGWTDAKNEFHLLRHKGPEHVLAIAPTRSGKGVGLVVPTLLSWTDSCIIHDIKGELWTMTSGWRQKYGKNTVLKFDPAAIEGSCSYNVLSEIRLKNDYAVSDVQNVVTILVDPQGQGLEADHWAGSAHSLLSGVILYSLYMARHHKQPTPSLYDIGYQLADPNREDDTALWEDMKSFNRAHSEIVCAIIQQTGSDMLQIQENGAEEYASVISTAKRFLNVYRDPIVQKNTSRSDFSVLDLVNNERPVSLYLVIRPADKDRLRPIIRLLMTQIMRVLTRDPLKFDSKTNRPLPMYKHRLLLLMDEFPTLKRLEIFEENLAYIASYGIKCYIICQDFSQIWKEYGEHESLTSNCHVRVAYAPNRVETAEALSKLAGTMTVNIPVIAEHHQRSGAMGSFNQNYQNVARPLLTTDEITRLPAPQKDKNGLITQPGDMLIFVAGQPPIYGTQPLYFQDKRFAARSTVATVTHSEQIRHAS